MIEWYELYELIVNISDSDIPKKEFFNDSEDSAYSLIDKINIIYFLIYTNLNHWNDYL